MKEKLVPVIGAAGNVGRGITEAFRNEGWEVSPIDPEINNTLEELTNEQFERLFSPVPFIVYVADCGNREEYVNNPNLGKENNERFTTFCRRVSRNNPDLIIWYVGGSWTKRKPDANWIVNNNSPNKNPKDCNSYERAKISAEENARKMSEMIKIRFLDWPSIVPNLAPNFSITRMIVQALEGGKISYSPGQFGRPLVEAVQAGEALIVLIKNDDNQKFARYLIPGFFIPFSVFAQAVKKIVEQEMGKEVVLEKVKGTPDFLKSQCRSDYLKKLGFNVDGKRTHTAIATNAKKAFKKIKDTQRS